MCNSSMCDGHSSIHIANVDTAGSNPHRDGTTHSDLDRNQISEDNQGVAPTSGDLASL